MNNKVFIIAEAGVNHNGSLEISKRMVDAACSAGADAIKFQTFKAENLVTRKASKSDYQCNNTKKGESQFDMLKNLELDISAHKELIRYCKEKKITFLSTPFDLESIGFLYNLGLAIFKIPSGEITNLPYLRKIGSLKRKIILSTGMSTLKEISNVLNILVRGGTKKENISVLHCNTAYPTPFEDVNLKAMITIKNKFKIEVGYSDHTLGIEVPIAAVALGATIVEKHFTLDRNMEGPDHRSSLDPKELKNMVDCIRNIEKALGNARKKPSLSELDNKKLVRKSIVAAKEIKMGEAFTIDNIVAKRPATGLSPLLWDRLLGKRAKRDFKRDELINL